VLGDRCSYIWCCEFRHIDVLQVQEDVVLLVISSYDHCPMHSSECRIIVNISGSRSLYVDCEQPMIMKSIFGYNG